MRKPMVWNSTAALAGLGALLVYILACTSFSPDDSKVLYVTVNPQSGLTAVAVYDRKTAKSELLFEPSTRDVGDSAARPALMRPQWLDGGHDFLTTWMPGGDDDKQPLNLAVVPFDRRGPTRTFLLSNLAKDGWGAQLAYWPAPVVGSNVFLSGVSNNLIRLNLVTGEMRVQTNEQQVMPIPSPDNDRLFYLGGGKESNSPAVEFGLLNPDTFASTPLFQFKDEKIDAFTMALSRDAKRLAYQSAGEEPRMIHLLETGQPARTLSLASLGEKTEVNLRHFSTKGDTLYGSFKSPVDDTHDAYGFVEIPLDGSAIRKTTLISNIDSRGKETLAFFQIDLSHDGKTLAVESVWLAYGEHPIKAEDCALFLVDLGDPQRKATKVPIPLPPKDSPAPFK
jgi:hypothetical protein